MKKKIVSALATALVVGATSSALAANPFVDVPRGHWAYSAVEQLANEGVIEGYGDNTYRGDRVITRYEMAQMVARALARNPQATTVGSTSISNTGRANLERLSAEFRDELDGFGVRLDELEKHADKVKWTGEVRYRYWNDKTAGQRQGKDNNSLQLRLFPTAEINENWTAKARITATDNMKDDNSGDAALTFVYAEGKYDAFTVRLGRMPLVTQADAMVDSGSMIADDFFSGLQLTSQFGDNITGYFNAGRVKKADKADYIGIEGVYDTHDALKLGAAFHYFKNFGANDRKAHILVGGASYQINDDMKVGGSIAHNNKATDHKTAYNVELDYLGANRNDPGSWGAFAAYRYVGSQVGFAPTYDSYGAANNKKGFDIGATYAPYRNTFAKVSYFHGKSFTGGTDKTWFTRVSLFF